MSTAPQQAAPQEAVISKNVTAYSIKVKNDEGDLELKCFTGDSRWNKFVEKYVKEHSGEQPVPDKVCNFITAEAAMPEGFAVLAPNPDVQCALFNRGASLKQLNEITTLMEDPDFEAPATPYDLRDIINRETERRAASTEDKVKKLLSDLDPDALQRVMAALLAKQGTAA